MRVIAAAVLLCAACAATADVLPARHDVIGTDDLVLRTAPDGDAPERTRRPASRHAVEITAYSEDGAWARTNFGDSTGWISRDRLRRQDGPAADGLPLRCYGTEPFWGLHLPAPLFAEFERPEHPELPMQITGATERLGPNGRVRLWTFAGDQVRASLLVRHESCSDGMSDRAFGLSAAFTLTQPSGEVLLSLGCCSLTAP